MSALSANKATTTTPTKTTTERAPATQLTTNKQINDAKTRPNQSSQTYQFKLEKGSHSLTHFLLSRNGHGKNKILAK